MATGFEKCESLGAVASASDIGGFTDPSDTNTTGALGIPGVLPDGWWVATIDHDDVTAGNSVLQHDLTVDCPVLTGDLSHTLSTNSAGDEQLTVGMGDLLTVESNLDASNATYAQGSIDYTGNVDEADLFGVEANFGATLTAPPTTPGSLAISNDGTNPQTTLDINWSAPANTNPNITLQSYKIQRSTDGETFSDIPQVTGGPDPDSLSSSATSFIDTGLTPGTRYWYRVRALYSDGSVSVYSAKTALDTILAPPTATVSTDGQSIALLAQSASDINASSLTYTWSTQSTPSGAPEPTFTGGGVGQSTTATVGAPGNYTFQVAITAPGGVVVSVASVTVPVSQIPRLSISPATTIVAIGAIQQFTASETDQFGTSMGQTDPTWSLDPTDDGRIDDTGFYTASSDTFGSHTITATLGPLTASATVTVSSAPEIADAGFESPALAAYAFQYDPTGTPWIFWQYSGVSANGSDFTSGCPNAPEGNQVGLLQMSSTIEQSVGGWAAGTYALSFFAAQRANWGNRDQNFQVLIDGDPVGSFDPSSISYAEFTTSTFTVAAGAHTIEFLGLDTAGGDNTAFLDDVTLTAVSGPTAPPAPTSLVATAASPSEIDLSWTGAVGATGYTIEMDSGDGSGMQPIDSVGDITSYKAIGLNVNAAYSFCVIATDAIGTSPPSNTATASTPDPIPQNLQAQPTSANEIDLTWSSNYTGEDGFAVEEEQSDGSWDQVDTVAGGTYTDDITGLTEATPYTFEAEAIYGASQSSPSNTASATTTLNAPSNASATAPLHSQANVTWTDNSTDEDGFTLTYVNGTSSGSVTIPPNGAGGTTGYALTGLTPGFNYNITITAFKGSIQSQSAQTSITMPTPDATGQRTAIGSVTVPGNANKEYDFAGSAGLLAGQYEVIWTGGAANFNDQDPGDYCGLTYPDHGDGFYVDPDGAGSSQIALGGPSQIDTIADAVAAIQGSPPSATFTHTSGPIGVSFYDFNPNDNSGDAVTWKLIQLPVANTLPTVSIATIADPGTLTQPTGDSIDDAFTISRTMPNDDYSSDLSVRLNPWLGTAIEGEGKDYTLEYQPTGWEGTGSAPTPPAPTTMSADSVDIPADYSGVTMMVQLLSSAAYNPSGTIFGLLKASSGYLLADSISGPAAAATGSTYTETSPTLFDIGWIQTTPGEPMLNAVANPAPPTTFAAPNGVGNANSLTLAAWEAAQQYRDVLVASLSATFDSATGMVVSSSPGAAQQVGYTPLGGPVFFQGTGKMTVTKSLTPNGKGVVFKALAKFRVAGLENYGFAGLSLRFHRLAWVWSEVSIELDAGNPTPIVKFAGSFVPSQTYYSNGVAIGGYSMPTNVAGVNQFLNSGYGSLGAGTPPL